MATPISFSHPSPDSIYADTPPELRSRPPSVRGRHVTFTPVLPAVYSTAELSKKTNVSSESQLSQANPSIEKRTTPEDQLAAERRAERARKREERDKQTLIMSPWLPRQLRRAISPHSQTLDTEEFYSPQLDLDILNQAKAILPLVDAKIPNTESRHEISMNDLNVDESIPAFADFPEIYHPMPFGSYDAFFNSGGFHPISRSIRWAVMNACVLVGKVIASFNHIHVHNAEALRNVIEERPKGIPLITLSNHSCTMDDPFIISWMLPRSLLVNNTKTRYVLCAQDVCFKSRLSSFFAYAGKALPIQRGAGLHQYGMIRAQRLVDGGNWVHLFPEGFVTFQPRLTDGTTVDPFFINKTLANYGRDTKVSQSTSSRGIIDETQGKEVVDITDFSDTSVYFYNHTRMHRTNDRYNDNVMDTLSPSYLHPAKWGTAKLITDTILAGKSPIVIPFISHSTAEVIKTSGGRPGFGKHVNVRVGNHIDLTEPVYRFQNAQKYAELWDEQLKQQRLGVERKESMDEDKTKNKNKKKDRTGNKSRDGSGSHRRKDIDNERANKIAQSQMNPSLPEALPTLQTQYKGWWSWLWGSTTPSAGSTSIATTTPTSSVWEGYSHWSDLTGTPSLECAYASLSRWIGVTLQNLYATSHHHLPDPLPPPIPSPLSPHQLHQQITSLRQQLSRLTNTSSSSASTTDSTSTNANVPLPHSFYFDPYETFIPLKSNNCPHTFVHDHNARTLLSTTSSATSSSPSSTLSANPYMNYRHLLQLQSEVKEAREKETAKLLAQQSQSQQQSQLQSQTSSTSTTASSPSSSNQLTVPYGSAPYTPSASYSLFSSSRATLSPVSSSPSPSSSSSSSPSPSPSSNSPPTPASFVRIPVPTTYFKDTPSSHPPTAPSSNDTFDDPIRSPSEIEHDLHSIYASHATITLNDHVNMPFAPWRRHLGFWRHIAVSVPTPYQFDPSLTSMSSSHNIPMPTSTSAAPTPGPTTATTTTKSKNSGSYGGKTSWLQWLLGGSGNRGKDGLTSNERQAVKGTYERMKQKDNKGAAKGKGEDVLDSTIDLGELRTLPYWEETMKVDLLSSASTQGKLLHDLRSAMDTLIRSTRY